MTSTLQGPGPQSQFSTSERTPGFREQITSSHYSVDQGHLLWAVSDSWRKLPTLFSDRDAQVLEAWCLKTLRQPSLQLSTVGTKREKLSSRALSLPRLILLSGLAIPGHSSLQGWGTQAGSRIQAMEAHLAPGAGDAAMRDTQIHTQPDIHWRPIGALHMYVPSSVYRFSLAVTQLCTTMNLHFLPK